MTEIIERAEPVAPKQYPISDEFRYYVDAYENTEETLGWIYYCFARNVNMIPALRAHRDFVVEHDHGYGARAFCYLWKLLVDQMPRDFKFLEIGVFKGQVISMIKLLGDALGKKPQIIGVTPLMPANDQYSDHPDVDYKKEISRIYQEFSLDTTSTTLIQGYSQAPEAVAHARDKGPYDIIYIDGCHDYPIVVNDIITYGPLLRDGGFLVMDDASTELNLPSGLWGGLPDVNVAIYENIDPDPQYTHLLACGHNRVWQKQV